MQHRVFRFFRKHSAKFLIVFVFVAGIGATNKYFQISKNLDIYASLFREVNALYVEEINATQLMQEGIDAMLKSLDPYTSFIPESDIEDFRFMTTGHYGGVGASISQRGDYVMISEIYEGFPAQKAGMMAGDLLIQIGDMSGEGKTSSEVSDILKGQPGSEVEVTVRRSVNGEEKEITMMVTRRQVEIPNVPFAGVVEDNLGYIKLSSFKQGATNEVRDAMENLKEEHNIEGLVLDLRNNPGGLLSESVNLVGLFVDRGETVVTTKGRTDDWNNEYRTRQDPVDTEIPLVILVNKSSASASEIVSGAIQDFDRGVVIGQNTFGKGSVQTTRSLSYNTQLKITTAHYYIPSGRSIQKIDEAVENKDVVQIKDDRPSTFTTRNGREVKESNGVTPDIELPEPKTSRLLRSLQGDRLIFDFATHFRHNKDEIGNAADFEVDEDLFDEFLTFVKDREFSYRSELERDFSTFLSKASTDASYSRISEEAEAIKEKLKTNIADAIVEEREAVAQSISEEIASRYHFRRGRVEASFRDDPAVLEAGSVFRNFERYDNILTAAE